MQQVTFGDTVRTPHEQTPMALSGVAVGDGPVDRFEVFVGPKDIDLLKKITPKLESVVDFGWMAFLAKPLFLIVNYVNDTMVHNFGWAIVLVTVALNFVLFQIGIGGGFWRDGRSGQAALPDCQLRQRYDGAQLRLGDRAGHGGHQLRPVPAEVGQHEVDAQDAGAEAAD